MLLQKCAPPLKPLALSSFPRMVGRWGKVKEKNHFATDRSLAIVSSRLRAITASWRSVYAEDCKSSQEGFESLPRPPLLISSSIAA